MTTATYEATRRTFSEAPAIPSSACPARRSLAPVVAMVAGLAVLAGAGALVVLPDRAGPAATVAAAPAVPAADPSGITLSERDVSVVVQVYEPGHDSGWHAHPGIHAVAVLSGTLTVYDGACVATTYGPGQPYVGGRALHLVHNESTVPVEMSVTYLSPTAPGSGTQRLSAPAGCSIAG